MFKLLNHCVSCDISFTTWGRHPLTEDACVTMVAGCRHDTAVQIALNTQSATPVDLKNKDGGIRPETLITYVRLHIQGLHSGFDSVGK